MVRVSHTPRNHAMDRTPVELFWQTVPQKASPFKGRWRCTHVSRKREQKPDGCSPRRTQDSESAIIAKKNQRHTKIVGEIKQRSTTRKRWLQARLDCPYM